MKMYKKITFGLGLLLSVFIFISIGNSSATALTRAEVLSDNYKMTALDTITLTVPGTPNNGGSTVYKFTDDDPNDTTYNYKYDGPNIDGGICGGGKGITLTGPVPPSNSDVTIVANIDISLQQGTVGQNNLNCSNDVKGQIQILVPAAVSSTSPGSGGTQSIEPTCESGSFTSLEWIMCPLFNIAADLTNKLVDEFKKQLCFKVDESQTSSKATCEATPTKEIKPAWNAIKNIVSALLVIIMLIAIFAQATSIGPVDAYTLRKLLPRLVAAVILIQISFYLFSWVVNVVDDLGEGLDTLLNSIFTSSSGVNLNDLDELLARAKVGVATATGANWVAIIGIIALGIASLPVLLLMLFGAAIAIFIAFAVLIFRKVLIIALLLIAPVALLLWILPNTERYWKMWWDNFLKILLMFPLIVLLIEAGRIFAFVAGPTAGNEFIALLIVMIGFFGPLFILPKTFKWGGTLMAMAGENLGKVGGSVGKPGKDYLEWRKGISRWNIARGQRRAILEQRAKRGFAEGISAQSGRGRLNRARLLGIGTPEGERDVLERAGRSAQAEVAKAEREEDEFANLRLQEEVDRTSPTNHDHLVRARALGQTQYEERDANGNRTGRMIQIGQTELRDRIAASRKLLQLGGTGNHQAYEQAYDHASNAGGEELRQFKRGITADIGTISSQLPHIVKGVDTTVAQLNEDSFASLSAAEMQTLLGNLSQRSASGDATAQQNLEILATKFQAALHTPGKVVNTGAAEAMSAFISDNPGFINTINADRGVAGTPQIDHSQRTVISTERIQDINTELVKRGSAGPAGTAVPSPTPTVTPGPGASVSSGVINIPHGSRTAVVVESDEVAIQRDVKKAGGWSRMSNPDLLRIYQYRTGNLKSSAEQELKNRGIFPS